MEAASFASRVRSGASSASASAKYAASQAVALSRSCQIRGRNGECGYRVIGKAATSSSAAFPRVALISPTRTYRRRTCATSTSRMCGAWSVSPRSNRRSAMRGAAGVLRRTSMSADASTTITDPRVQLERLAQGRVSDARVSDSRDAHAIPRSWDARQRLESHATGNRTTTFQPRRHVPSTCDEGRRVHASTGSSSPCAKHTSMWSTCQCALAKRPSRALAA